MLTILLVVAFVAGLVVASLLACFFALVTLRLDEIECVDAFSWPVPRGCHPPQDAAYADDRPHEV